jgi:hypothetical protein
MSLVEKMLFHDQPDHVIAIAEELRKMAKPTCRKCYGRGFVAKMTGTGAPVICSSCLRLKARGNKNA